MTDEQMCRRMMLVPILGMAAIAVWSLAGLNVVKVNGASYRRIILGEELIADVLPPPAHLLKADLNALELIHEADPRALAGLLTTAQGLRSEYVAHHAFWERVLPAGDPKLPPIDRAYAAGLEFLDIRDKELIPRVIKGDRVGARRLLETVLRARYQEHLAAIQEVIRAATTENRRLEQDAKVISGNRRTVLQIGGMLGCAWSAATVAMAVACRRRRHATATIGA